MLRISALNDSSCSEDDSQKIHQTQTKEAKEAEAFAIYNKALSHQQKGNTLHAEKLLRNLTDHPLLKEASHLADDENVTQTLNHPGLQLLYSIRKNLASILLQRSQLQDAMAAYIEAVKIDSSEVTVWFKMGQVAREIHNYPLAKICFQQALRCNPNHWPSLDNAITVTFALGDYLTCLENISTALEKDYSYPKGLVLRKQILSEQASLESVTSELFLYCDPRMHTITVDQDEAKEYINEALKIRAKRRQLLLEHQEKELQPLTFLKPLTPFTWKNVGEQLIDLYDYAVSSTPSKSLALEVDLRDYYFLDHLAFLGENVIQDKPATPPRKEVAGSVRLSAPLLKNVTSDVAEDDVNSPFQRAQEQAGSIPSVPLSLNIKDNAKESALIRRIQGDLAQAGAFFSEYPNVGSRITNQALPDVDKESVSDELELEAMDMSDVPLLQEEDMNMAVLSLKDIRKADFRPELLLKTNVEDLSSVPDARSLENVLSSVIDMEMQDMYPKDFTQDCDIELSSKGAVAASSSLPQLPEVERSQMSDVLEVNIFSVQAQNKVVVVSTESSDPVSTSLYNPEEMNLPAQLQDRVVTMSTESLDPVKSSICHISESNLSGPTQGKVMNLYNESSKRAEASSHINELNQLMSDVTATPASNLALDISAQSKSNPLHSLVSCHINDAPSTDVRSVRILQRVCTSSPQVYSSTICTLKTLDSKTPAQSNQAAVLACTSAASHILPPPAHTAQIQSQYQAHSSPRTNVSPPPAHSTQSLMQSHSSPRTIVSSPSVHSIQSLLEAHSSPRTIVSPPAAHSTQSQSLMQAHSSPLANVSPAPAHNSQSLLHSQATPGTNILPPTAHTSSLGSLIPNLQTHILLPQTIQQPERASPLQTSQEALISHSSSALLTLPTSVATPAISQLRNVSATLNLPQQPLKTSSGLTVSPTEYVHSPITTSLLSPNSIGSCPRSASVYHSVLSSIERSDTDSTMYKTSLTSLSEQKPDLPSFKSTHGSSESFQGEERVPLLKSSRSQLCKSSSDLFDRLNTEDLIVDARNKLQGVTSTERSSQLPKTYQTSQQSRLSPHHSSPQTNPGLVQISSNRSHSHQPQNPAKPTLLHHAQSLSMIPLPQPDTPTYLSLRTQAGHEVFRENLGSLPNPVNSLSLLDVEAYLAERTTEKLTAQRQTCSKHSRPPPLSRSSSLPGYYTHAPEHNLLSYLSTSSQTPLQVSSFNSIGKQSPHVSTPRPLPSMVNASSSTVFPLFSHPSSHPDTTTHLYSIPLYSGLSPSRLNFPPSTLPSYITPPRLTKYMPGYQRHQENIRLPPGLTSKGYFDGKIEKMTQESRIIKPSSPSYSRGHHHSHSTKPHNLPQKDLSQQQTPSKDSQATTQLQNLARITQQVPSYDEIYSVSGDHSYQKQNLVLQAMIEAMLSTTGTSVSRPTSSQALHMTSKGSQQDLNNSVSEANRKRNPGGSKTPGIPAKRGPKRKMDESGSDDWASVYKRRSTRSRNTRNRKEDKSVDYQKLMKKYFPRSLLHLEPDNEGEKNDEADMEVDKYGDDAGKNYSVDFSSLKNLAVDEEECIKTYIKKCLKGHGILDLVYKYLLHLARKCDRVWYDGIVDIYVNLYVRLRKHLTIPTLFCGDDDTFTPEGLREYSTVILTWAELSLSRAAAESGTRSYLLPSKPGLSDNATLGEYYNEDMMFLLSLAGRDDALGSFRGEFSVRLYWLKARQHQHLGETADAVECFEIVSELLEDVASEKGLPKNKVKILLPNISQVSVISLSETSKQLECLQRCKSLEDTQKLYDQARYEQVVENLISTFTSKDMSSKTLIQRERPSQLLLLVNSLYNVKHKYECMHWAEVSLQEAILHYKRVPTLQLREDWAATLVALFICIDRIMDEDNTILKSLAHKDLVRLAHNLISVIEISLDVVESVTEMPIGSLLPWKILYRVLKFEEVSCDLNKQKVNEDFFLERGEKENDDEKDLSPSLLMLKEAHAFLGRHSWCTKDGGALLSFIMSVVEREMAGKNEDDLDELKHIFEQCVYCLYGHPNKRGRARHLSDHNTSPVTLTWEKSGPVFRHFATQSVPEFDSYRTSTVTADVENLLRRIFALVPEKINPGQGLSVVTDYIEGVSNTVPSFPVMSIDKDIDPYNISDLLYYLLGDFYFKSKEPAKAVKFYLLDLVINSYRLDSWAGLALAKMSQIEQKLNSTELKIEKPIHKNSEGALRCFRKAVELETGSCKLWLEYGSLAYQLHSHASRQIKYKDMFAISEEVLRMAMSRCTDLLHVAKNSYQQASKCEGDGTEEDWLTFYMMGKVAEKQQEDPAIYLEYYKQAAVCLHEERAVYPKKIQFVNPRPHLALEALEIFYRIHVCVLKLVLSGRGDEHLPVLDRYVSDALQGHFAMGEEKQQKILEEDREETFVSPKPLASTTHSQQVYHKNPTDHEYSRHKSTSDSHSEGEDSRSLDQSKAGAGAKDRKLGEHSSAKKQTGDSVVNTANVEIFTGITSPSQKELLNPDTLMQPGTSSMTDSKIPDGIVIDGTDSCGDSLKQSSFPTSFSACEVHMQENVEERMETCESGEACKVMSETSEDVTPGGISPKRMLGPVVPSSESNKEDSCLNVIGMSHASSPVSELADCGHGMNKDSIRDSKQDDSQGNSQDNKQDDSQGNSQDSKQDDSQGNSQDNKQDDSQGNSQDSKQDDSQGNSQDSKQDDSQGNSQDDNSQGNSQDDNSQGNSQDDSQGNIQDSKQDNSQGNSQDDNSQGNSQDDNSQGNIQDSKQDDSQDSIQVGESSEEDAAMLSCGNEADVDTDAMDVDDDDVMSTSCRTSQDSSGAFMISNNASKTKVMIEDLKPEDAGEMIEVHAGDDVSEMTADISTAQSDLCRSVSEGFTPYPGNLEDALGKMVDSQEDSKQQVLGLSEGYEEPPMIEDISDSLTKLKPKDDQQEKKIVQMEISDDRLIDLQLKGCSDGKDDVKSVSSEQVDMLEGDENSILKNKIVDIGQNNQDKDEEGSKQKFKSQKELEDDNELRGESVVQNAMDGTGDLKEARTKMEKHQQSVRDTEVKGEDEKWEMESQEKSSGQILEMTQPTDTFDVSHKENISSTQPGLLVLETSESKSVQSSWRLPSYNEASPPKESGAANAMSCSQEDKDVQKAELISKCRTGLEICASRFPSHYKSLYRLAHLYYNTKELDKARDILLGRPDWQEQSHMPAPGLFSERKQNNFFQGLWKIPVEDIDRSGCFVTHVHRSVRLLLDVLCDLGDLEMLKNLHNQLRRTPEPGKKYLRDAERLVLAEEAYLKCVTVVQHDMETSDCWSEEQREENLLRIYHVWMSGKGCKHIDKITDALHKAFKIMMKGRTDVNRLTAAQAISFCQQNMSKMLTPSTPTTSSTHIKLSGQVGPEKARDSLTLAIEEMEVDKSSSKQNEPVQEYAKPEDATKTVSLTQQNADVNPSVGEPGPNTAITTSSAITTTSVVSDHACTESQNLVDDVIILSD